VPNVVRGIFPAARGFTAMTAKPLVQSASRESCPTIAIRKRSRDWEGAGRR
jgi:hypothetical protein